MTSGLNPRLVDQRNQTIPMTEGGPPSNDGKKPEQNRRNRGARGRFLPGNQANPLGRPKGSRNRVTRSVEQLLDGEAETLTYVLVKRAKAGDSAALSLVFARLAPPRKGRTIEVALPPLDNLVASHDALITAVACGDLTPAEGTPWPPPRSAAQGGGES